METISITKANALKAYKSADKAIKTALENLLGAETFKKTGDITDRIKTFEDACAELGVEIFETLGQPSDVVAYRKLRIISEALNEGWRPNWNDSNEYKYYPYFEYAGSGFSHYSYDHSCARSGVGSRLCFKTSKLAIYAGKQFIKEYNDYLNS